MKLDIRPPEDSRELEECARIMSSIEPWVTFRRTYERSLEILSDPERDVYVAVENDTVAGFLILCMTGAFVGYIQTVAVAPASQGKGIGSKLIAFAEEKIFAASPNSFLCVSSFNPDARRLYERLGYTFVGELTDYNVRGHSELLFRKSRGPWSDFRV